MKTHIVKEKSVVYPINIMKNVITSDGFFHYVMEKSDILRLLICQSIIDDHIIETKVEKTEFYQNAYNGKKMILDIVARDEQRHLYNIEMQKGLINEDDFIRFQCYAYKLLERQERKGVNYHKIKDVYQLIISEKNISDLDEYQYDFMMYDEKQRKSLPYHKVHMRIVQLERLERVETTIDKVMYLLKTGRRYQEERTCKEVEEIMDKYWEFIESDDYFAWCAKDRDERLYHSKLNYARKEGIAKGKEEGKEEGIAKGKEEGRKETLYQMYSHILEKKYHKDTSWLKRCSLEQLSSIGDYILEDISLTDLKKYVFNVL